MLTYCATYAYISIHALREEGDIYNEWFRDENLISIHALREEGDRQHRQGLQQASISIHALREEGDAPCWHITSH